MHSFHTTQQRPLIRRKYCVDLDAVSCNLVPRLGDCPKKHDLSPVVRQSGRQLHVEVFAHLLSNDWI